jgi:hypothetical protein
MLSLKKVNVLCVKRQKNNVDEFNKEQKNLDPENVALFMIENILQKDVQLKLNKFNDSEGLNIFPIISELI